MTGTPSSEGSRPGGERVCAVVVTHNRRSVVPRTLRAILAQTRPPDAVLVVDNGSRDGTAEALARDFPQVRVLRFDDDKGSAGGFHAGMRAAFEGGFDWIWTMDDDAVPRPNCLELLLAHSDGDLLVRFPQELVLGTDEPLYRTRGEARQGVIYGAIGTVNGRLVHRGVVERIGLPRRELFLFYDDTEYAYRAKAAGMRVGVVLAAQVEHPATPRLRRKHLRFAGFGFGVQHVGDRAIDFLLLRNGAFVMRRYRGAKALARYLAGYFVFYLVTYGPGPAFWAVRVAWAGARGDLRRRR